MGKKVFNLNNNLNEKLDVGSLKIGNNVIIYNESFITINNIASVSLGKEPPKRYQKWLFVVPIIGFWIAYSDSVFTLLMGLIAIAILGTFIYLIYDYNKNLQEYIIIHLNSGKTLFLNSSNHEFSLRVMDTIINCINTGESYNINFNSCSIQNLQNGEVNTMKCTNE